MDSSKVFNSHPPLGQSAAFKHQVLDQLVTAQLLLKRRYLHSQGEDLSLQGGSLLIFFRKIFPTYLRSFEGAGQTCPLCLIRVYKQLLAPRIRLENFAIKRALCRKPAQI
jgi:hypothetical protein